MLDSKTQIIKQWINALRSGTYNQGFNNLNCNGKFCAFGVLYDTLNTNVWVYKEGVSKAFVNTMISIPITMQFSNDELDSILYMNDTEKLPFDEIANYLENEYLLSK